MDIVVHTSLREGLARVLPQALIVGRPVISYDIDGAREVVLDGQTGLLLPPQSVEPLADAILRLAADPQLRARMGAEGRRLFTDAFRQERMVEELRRLYERLLQYARRRPNVELSYARLPTRSTWLRISRQLSAVVRRRRSS